MANNKRSLYASTAEERLQKIKRPPYPSISKVESVTTVYHLMEWKHGITIAGGSQYLDCRKNKKRKVEGSTISEKSMKQEEMEATSNMPILSAIIFSASAGGKSLQKSGVRRS